VKLLEASEELGESKAMVGLEISKIAEGELTADPWLVKTQVGVLALQGRLRRHVRALEAAGAQVIEVRTAADLAAAMLVIPGGESTTMLKLLHREGLFEPLCAFGREKPIFGTCAGAILLAST
jgi:putative intracellular protease/amidase